MLPDEEFMHRKKLLWHLYPSYLFITISALIAVTWFGSQAIKKFHLDQTAKHLEAKAHIASGYIESFLEKREIATIDAFCEELGRKSSTRITVIDHNGRVLGDSEEDPARMDNHSDRPEIMAALENRIESSIRFSSTLQKNMMYVAVPLKKDGKIEGAIRASVSVASIDKALQAIQAKIFLGCLAAAFIVVFISWIISRRISRPLEEMRQGAGRFSEGDFDRKLVPQGAEEIAALADSMNHMAYQLENRIQTVVQQKNELEAVFSSMVEGVFVFDKHERFININKAGANLIDAEPSTAKGKTLLEVVRNIDLQKFVTRTLSDSGPIEGEITVHGPEGERFFQAHGVQLRSRKGNPIGGLMVINDVTRIRKLENLRRDFVANVSHELKTPITSIQGFVETLLDGAIDDPENARKFLEIIAKQSKRLHAIIEDLLALARIEKDAEVTPLVFDEYHIKKVLQSAIQSCESKATEKNINIVLDCSENLIAEINPPLLEQAIVNLIDNAVKYGPEKSVIRVQGVLDDEEMLVTVKDEGPGIPREHQARLFERFYRVDKARSKDVGGTGLGLSIVKHIVQVHGGRVTLESALGRGSDFIIHLPKKVHKAD